ncbi:MAG: EamA family transporter RarD [Gemmataceae bacterium]|nr:EamA family transporter RarD [Gemmataceae bacterium]
MNQTKTTAAEFRLGLFFGLASHTLWGAMPLYIWLVKSISPVEILAHRVAWSFLVITLLVWGQRKWRAVKAALRGKILAGLIASSVLIAVNWGIYIYAATTNQVLQASLGYFLLPLFSFFLGQVLFREKLDRVELMAIFLVALGIAVRIAMEGKLPWIALVVALSFCLYGVLRKVLHVDATTGLFCETLFLLPMSLGALAWWQHQGTGVFGKDPGSDFALALSGLVTVAPLFCFVVAARILPLTLMGFIQYISPTMQFLLGIVLFGEEFTLGQQICFALIWTALGLFSWNTWKKRQDKRREELAPFPE